MTNHSIPEDEVSKRIAEIERLSHLCEKKVSASASPDKQIFFKGMAMAFTSSALKFKGQFDEKETDENLIEQFYNAASKTEHLDNRLEDVCKYACSFCGRSKEEAGELALGPAVSICESCLQFGKSVIAAQMTAKE
ncbi:ClpX C4-type zinc finger protein [Bacillus xiapuensis]|uniref:ClpX C4-type zinc finger protein n=1 Tax=Bacillus xiapuensis TaxID=2014075 RepID=UPI000C24F690|nr:ClpX C4-type zinc finger protein [Bacillus xiapuensis]